MFVFFIIRRNAFVLDDARVKTGLELPEDVCDRIQKSIRQVLRSEELVYYRLLRQFRIGIAIVVVVVVVVNVIVVESVDAFMARVAVAARLVFISKDVFQRLVNFEPLQRG